MDLRNAGEVTGTRKAYHCSPFAKQCPSPPSLLQPEGRGFIRPCGALALLPLGPLISPPSPSQSLTRSRRETKAPGSPLGVSMGTKALLVLPALQMLISEQSILAMPRMRENHPHPSTDQLKNLPRFHLLSAAGRGHNAVQQMSHHTGPCLSPTLHMGCGSS